MIKDVARRYAHVVHVRRAEVREVTAVLIDELEADLRVGSAAVDDDLVAPVAEAEPACSFGAVRERAARHHRRRVHRDVGEVVRFVETVGRALPAVAAPVCEV